MEGSCHTSTRVAARFPPGGFKGKLSLLDMFSHSSLKGLKQMSSRTESWGESI